MRVFVTGGSGFIGSHLVDRFVELGFEVVVPVRSSSNLKYLLNRSVEKIEIDLRDKVQLRRTLKGVEIVYHLASIRGSGWSLDDKEVYTTNVDITRNLLIASAAQKVRRFVYVSSVSVFGHAHGGPISDSYPILPATRYGWTKYYSEQLVKKHHQEERLQATIIRPVITYGPRDTSGMIPKLVELIYSGRYLTVGNGKNRIHLIYIDDLIDGMMLAMVDKTKDLEIFTFAGIEPITINYLVKAICSLLGTGIVNIHLPIVLGRLAGYSMEFIYKLLSISREPIVTRDKVDIMCRDRFFDIEKTKEKIGFLPKIDYELGLKQTIYWLKEAKYIH